MQTFGSFKLEILLIGSRGFLGFEILSQLKILGHEVRELNSSDFQGHGLLDSANLTLMLTNHKFDIVMTTAWVTNRNSYRDSKFNSVYSEATINLAKLCRELEVPVFVALGSAAEYGRNNKFCDAAKSKLHPEDEYSLEKIRAYKEISTELSGSMTRFIWPRIFQPYGFNQDPSRLFPSLISMAKLGLPQIIEFPDKGSDWISSYDVAKAIIFAIENQIWGAVDVGTGTLISNLDLAKLVYATVGSNLEFTQNIEVGEIEGLSVSKDSNLFKAGWSPIFDVNAGLEKLVFETSWQS